jgi:flagellar basal-body rod modification protein FlgD
MATTTAIQDVIASTQRSAGPLSTTSAADIQDRFLTLLVTQLRNQDPLSPMDNSQITTQLSQISTVSGIDKLNDTMAGLSAALATSQSMSSASMIGRQVVAPGSTLTLADKRAAGALELAEPADKVTVSILGPAGDVVRRLELGPSQAGLQAFTWDGTAQDSRPAKDGAYTFKVEAQRAGKAVGAATHIVGTVTGIGVSGKDPSVIVNGGTEVRFADVKRVQ